MNELRTKNDKNTLKNAFSLLEMMVVLLIVSILAAATAPMVTKKMARSTGSGDSPWVFTGLNSSIAYNLNGNDNAPVIIGATSTPASLAAPTRLFIDSGNTASHIAFGNGNATPLGITADPANGRIGISNSKVPNNSVAFGSEQQITDTLNKVVVLGKGAIATADNSIVIGEASAGGSAGVAIGNYATATRGGSIAIGGLVLGAGNPAWGSTVASGEGAIAIGSGLVQGNQASMSTHTIATGTNSIAIGRTAQARHENSVAIGSFATTTAPDQIVLGGRATTVFIPGNLIVGGDAYIGSSYTSGFTGPHFKLFLRRNDSNWTQLTEPDGRSDIVFAVGMGTLTLPWSSDRRLKNVGEAYTAGLDELKKLEFFHYTFKKDEAKTPHVGVMAQDLEKVFPNAVTKGEDGYLRIRMEDMFYAVINAVKELDTKITEIVENVTSLSKKVDEQEKTIAEQQKLIEDLEQRLTQVEKNRKKVVE